MFSLYERTIKTLEKRRIIPSNLEGTFKSLNGRILTIENSIIYLQPESLYLILSKTKEDYFFTIIKEKHIGRINSYFGTDLHPFTRIELYREEDRIILMSSEAISTPYFYENSRLKRTVYQQILMLIEQINKKQLPLEKSNLESLLTQI